MPDIPVPFAFLNIGWQEWLIIGVVCVLLFGRRLPEVGRNLGRSFVEFKRGLSEARHEIESAGQEPPKTPANGQAAAPSPPVTPAVPAPPADQPDDKA